MENQSKIKFTSYDRLFPNQDTMPKGGFGNLIALPLEGLASKNNNSEFVDDNFVIYPDQWAFLSTIQTSIVENVSVLKDAVLIKKCVCHFQKRTEKERYIVKANKPTTRLLLHSSCRLVCIFLLYFLYDK